MKMKFLTICVLAAVLAPSARAENYAILFAGGGNQADNHIRYYNGTVDMYNALTGTMNYLPQNVFILAADGLDPADDINGDGNSDWSLFVAGGSTVDSATHNHLRDTINNLAGVIQPHDTFYLWTFDHGGGTSNAPATFGEEWLTGWGSNIRDDELAAWLAPVSAARQVYFFGQCFSGGMLDDLGIAGGSGMFGAAACNHYETSKWWTGDIGDKTNGYLKGVSEAILDHGLLETREIHDWAFAHAYHCRDGGQNGGTYNADWQHPWSVGDSFDMSVAHWLGGEGDHDPDNPDNWRGGLMPNQQRPIRINGAPEDTWPGAKQVIFDGDFRYDPLIMIYPGNTLTALSGARIAPDCLEDRGGRVELDHSTLDPHAMVGLPDMEMTMSWFFPPGDTAGKASIELNDHSTFEVSGSLDLSGGSDLTIHANGGIVLTDGGFSFNGSLETHTNAQIDVGGDFILGNEGPTTANIRSTRVEVNGSMEVRRGTTTLTGCDTFVDHTLYIANEGDATLDVRGGEMDIGYMFLGFGAGRTGRLHLHRDTGAPSLLVHGDVINLYVGWHGDGELIQDAGVLERVDTDQARPNLWLGHSAGTTGTYELNDGSGVVQDFTVGHVGEGIFRQRGGTLLVMGEMRVGNNATGDGLVVLEGGTLNVDDLEIASGTGRIRIDGGALWLTGATAGIQTLDIGGGIASVGWFDPGDVHLTVETLNIGINGTGTLAQNENLIEVTAALTVGHTGRGSVEQTGGQLTADVVKIGLNTTGDGTYKIGHGAELDVTGEIRVGDGGVGRVIHADFPVGGAPAFPSPESIEVTTVSADKVIVGRFSDSVENEYRLEKGRLDADCLVLGEYASGAGKFSLTGPAAGIYTNLSTVGGRGAGTFDQQDGWHDVDTELRLGLYADSHGIYTFSGGTIHAENTVVGFHGVGVFEQTGGNHIINGLLQLGYTSTGEGIYTQTGGDCTVRGDAYVAYGDDSTGDYTLGGGPLEGITQQVDGDLYLGYGEDSDGTYIVEEKIYHVGSGWTHAGELTVAGTVHVGAAGSGRLEVRAAGKLIADGAVIVGSLTDPGAIELDGGKIMGAGNMTITAGNGTLRGRGVVEIPLENRGTIDLPTWNYLSCDGGFSQEAGGETSIAEGAELTLGGGGTLGGAWINRGQLRISSGTFHLNAPLNGGDDPDGALAVDNGTLHANQPVEASGITVYGTLHVAAGVRSASTEVQHGEVYQGTGEVDAGDLTIVGGSYELAGPGNLTAGEVKALGDFTHLDAVHTVDVVRIGGDYWGYLHPGEYTISGGRLEVGSVYVGEQGWVDPFFPELGGPDIPGTLAVTDASVEVYVSERMVLSPAATIEAVPGTVIHMTGSNFENQSQTPADMADLAHVEMIFEGGAVDIDPFEVAGEDRRQLPCGLRNNFALGALTLGGTDMGQVQLVDLIDNHPVREGAESLYLHRLDLAAGSSLDLNGLNLYYEEGSIDPGATIMGGAVIQIYGPTTSISIEGLPEGSDVAMTVEPGGSGGMGTTGMTGAGEARTLSFTVRLDETDVAEAIAALGGGDAFVTVNIHYDPLELAILELDENSLRPYWWNESAGEWVLCGTTTAGLIGEGLFAGVDVHAADYGIGYCGIDTDEHFLWANVNHASTYGASGIPEPATLSLLALGGMVVLCRCKSRRSARPAT